MAWAPSVVIEGGVLAFIKCPSELFPAAVIAAGAGEWRGTGDGRSFDARDRPHQHWFVYAARLGDRNGHRLRDRFVSNAEEADLLQQLLRLLLHRLAGCRRLFHQRSVLLCGLIHLRDGVIHLIDARGLLLAGGRNLRDHIGDFLDAFDDFSEGLAGLIDQVRSGLHLVHRILDQIFDLFRRRGAALCQIANFARDHGEAAALFAGASCFDRGV